MLMMVREVKAVELSFQIFGGMVEWMKALTVKKCVSS